MKFKHLFLLLLLVPALTLSCNSKRRVNRITKKNVASNRTLTVQFYPFWGGSATSKLERKNGKDNLYASYTDRSSGQDSITSIVAGVNKPQADSIFITAMRLSWNETTAYGTADSRTGMKVSVTLKKGQITQILWFERLKDVNELPPSILDIVNRINAVTPEEFRMF